MPEPTISVLAEPGDLNTVADEIAKLQKYLRWLLSSLDSLNVKEIVTNLTRVHSKYGETVIDGPRLLMYDRQATPRLRLRAGYDEVTGDFLFELYNKAGGKTVGIDSNGDATFTGTITGGLIRTAVSGDRIEITGNSLKTYRNISGTDYLYGPAWGTGVGALYGDLSFYDQGIETFRIENALIGAGWTLRPVNGGALYVGCGGAYTYASGYWSFSTATSIAGLVTSTGTTGPGGADNHTHSIPSLSVVIG